MLTLRQLRYLDALARHKHFGRAADECAVSQPALSMQIHELEECLGGGLIERRQGEAVLTSRGLEVAGRAAAILSATRDLIEFAGDDGKVLSGPLRLGIIPTLAPYILPRILPYLQKKFPGLRLNVLETKTKTLVNELARGNVDLLLLTLPIDRCDVETVELFEDRFLLALPAGDPLPETARATPQDVTGRNLILLEEGHCLSDQALDYCTTVRSDAKGFFGASLTTIMQMVASGFGVTLLPEIAIDVELRDDRIKLLRFAEPQPRRHVGLMWRRTSPCRSDYIAFGQIVSDVATSKRPLTKPAPLSPVRHAS